MWTSWTGGQRCRPCATDRPLDEAGVVSSVRRAAERRLRVRSLGAGRSWSPLAVTDEVHLDCSALTGVIAIAGDRVRVRAGATLAEVLGVLAQDGRTLDAIPGALDVTVAGAVATGTHGSGPVAGSLSAQVAGVRLVDGTGEVRRVEGAELDAARCALGVLGVLTQIDLVTVPAHLLAAREVLRPLVEVLEDGTLDSHHRVELEIFPDGQALVRHADPIDADPPAPARGHAVRAAAVGSAHALGRVVPRLAPALRRSTSRWSGSVMGPDRQVLVAGEVRGEVSEWALPRAALSPALRELDVAAGALGVGPRTPVQVRVGAAESGWLSPAHQRDTAWVAVRVPPGSAHESLFSLVGRVLAASGGRPHWAGHHDWTVTDVGAAYPRLADFLRVRDRFDPDRRFTSPVMDALLGP